MIYYLVTAPHAYTMAGFLKYWAPQLAASVQVVPYAALPRNPDLPLGTYIFSDLERLTDAQSSVVEYVAARLQAHEPPARIMNHPARSLRRYGLLRALAERGINRFDCHRAAGQGAPWRYPVFIRVEDEHSGALSPLLRDEAGVKRALLDQVMQGTDPERLLVVEFCETVDDDGIYRKYSAHRVGDRILPRHILFSRSWVLKDTDLLDADQRQEVVEYVRSNPHADRLMEIFELAGIEYGRIDYGLLDGEIQVWEINTNPLITREPRHYGPDEMDFHRAHAARFADALLALDSGKAGGRCDMDWGGAPGRS